MAIKGAVIVPHPPVLLQEIGHGEQCRVQKTIDAYKEAAASIVSLHPKTLIVLSPHAPMYGDYFHISNGADAAGDFGPFGAPDLKLEVTYDQTLIAAIERKAQAYGVPAGTKGAQEKMLDHGTMVPLYFLGKAAVQQKNALPFRIVRIGLSGLPLSMHYQLGRCIKEACEETNRSAAIIASGDLSHRLLDRGPYEYAKEGPEYDALITKVMEEGDLKKALSFSESFCEKAGECGHRAIAILAGCLDDMLIKPRLLSYEGPFGVGYAVAYYEDACTALAKRALLYYMETEKSLPLPKDLPEELLKTTAGVFVSFKREGQLRGCIGTIQGVQKNIAMEIIENAVSAGLYDPRFPQITKEELSALTVTVDVLSKPEPVQSMAELDVSRYGVIVSCGQRRGLLLPNLDGVDTVEEQVAIALKKAGIEEDEYQLERFEVVRHY